MKVRYGFVTNSSSSSFVVKSSNDESPYTIEEVREVLNYLLDLYNNRFDQNVKEGSNYIISDSKDDSTIKEIFSEYACWGAEDPINCPLPYSLMPDDMCNGCHYKDICQDKESLLDIAKDGDVFVVSYENSMPTFILETIGHLFRTTYINEHMG